jgi:uncharacterized protein
MTKQENIATIKGAYEAFTRGDIPAALAIYAEDIDWTVPGSPDVIPFAGRVNGRAAVAKFFELLAASEEVLAFEPREIMAERDTVVVCLFYRARVKATGRTYEGEGIHVFHFRNGKVASFKEFIDTGLMLPAYKKS